MILLKNPIPHQQAGKEEKGSEGLEQECSLTDPQGEENKRQEVSLSRRKEGGKTQLPCRAEPSGLKVRI